MRTESFADPRTRDVTMQHGIGRVLFKDFFGQGHQVLPGPQAYLAQHVDPHSEIYPHFHDVDQFQIFIGGSGRIGKDPVHPVVAHYSDAYSPYGPIVAGGSGDFEYFTLRLAAASGGWRMPGNKHLLRGKPGRGITVAFKEFDHLPSQTGLLVQSLWGPENDELEIASLRAGPNTAFQADERGGGQYLLVTSGSVIVRNVELPAKSLIFLERGESAPKMRAGPRGAVLLVLRYPLPSERPGSDPAKLSDRSSSYDMAATNVGL